MGNLYSDADSEYGVLPDVIWQLTNGELVLYAVDAALETDEDVTIGKGWGNYRIF